MKALLKLQGAVIVQAAEHKSVADKFNERARTFVAVGALVAAALAGSNAHAQQGPLTPSNCAIVGATVGGVVGGAIPKNNMARVALAAIGGLGGAAAGHWLCAPKPLPSQDSSYNRAANYGAGNAAVGDYAVERSAPKAPLSTSEQEQLDDMSAQALHAKVQWKKALYGADVARSSGNRGALAAALETEAEARHDFEVKRDAFSGVVSRLHQGVGGEPRAVGRYLEVSAALLELNTESRVSYQMLEARDTALKARSQTYAQEADRAARTNRF